MNDIKQGIIDNIQLAARDAASEALGDIVESALDSVHIDIGDDIADHVIKEYVRKGASFTEAELNALLHATCLAIAYLGTYDIAQNVYKVETSGVLRGGVPVFSPEGMKDVVDLLTRQIGDVGSKVVAIRDALKE